MNRFPFPFRLRVVRRAGWPGLACAAGLGGGLLAIATCGSAQIVPPPALVLDGIPPLPESLRERASRYLESRTAGFQDWHPQRRAVLITTRFADTAQLHLVGAPGGARRQLTFLPEPVAGGRFHPRTGECLVFSRDTGGGEFYQLYRYDLADGRITLLTDGQSRNTGLCWAPSGRGLAYSSTRRNGRDTDIYVMNPAEPATDRRVAEVQGGGWSVLDWSPEESTLLIQEYRSIRESRLHLLELAAGRRRLLAPTDPAAKVAYGTARFARDGRSVFATSDLDSEFHRLVQIELATGMQRPLMPDLPGDVEDLELSPDGRLLALVVNRDGASELRLWDTRRRRERQPPVLPAGVLSGLRWHPNGRELAFTLSSARSPGDVFSVDVRSGRVERWTESETGGLDAARFVEPELVKPRSFDGLPISAWVYRPDPARFPGRRPVVVVIHGGPEAQSRPGFLGRNNFYLEELGVALVYPNVRGSSGYGKTFLDLDNGFRREDAVRDIGAVLQWIRDDARLDGGRIAVMGGSYGGYMVLASLIHHGAHLRAGVNVVGISNFLTFLQNTQEYRRDLRRAEYGDERDPAMRAFLEQISPTTHVEKINRPLLIVQGANDPRVPASESEQMVRALRQRGNEVWYLLAKDEGHGFAKKPNADFQFLTTIHFFERWLLAD